MCTDAKTPEIYLSEDEILADMIAAMDADERGIIGRVATREGMVLFHHTAGRALRNKYKLWEVANPHSKAYCEPNAEGIIDDPLFPDQVSARILERVWDAVHGTC